MAKADSNKTGNAGEHLVMAELLSLGWHAGLADRGNAAFDIIAHRGDETALIRVKTSNTRTVQWSGKKSGEIFLEMKTGNNSKDLVAIVVPKNASGPFRPREAEIYFVPTWVADKDIRRAAEEYFSRPKRDGTPRKKKDGWYTIRVVDGESTAEWTVDWSAYKLAEQSPLVL